MKNLCKYSTDGLSVYVELSLVSTLVGKIILVILNLIGWSGFILLFAFIEFEEPIQAALPALFIGSFLIFVLGRFTAWNFWGKEYFRVSPNSITYQRSYGFIMPAEKTIKFSRFAYGYKNNKLFDNENFGTFYFYNYKETDEAELVYENAIHISEADAEKIMEIIDDIIDNESSLPNQPDLLDISKN